MPRAYRGVWSWARLRGSSRSARTCSSCRSRRSTWRRPTRRRARRLPASSTEACADTPWVLLGAGVGQATFVDQVRLAGTAGAAGFLAGRGIWGPALVADPDEAERLATAVCRPALERCRATAERSRPAAAPAVSYRRGSRDPHDPDPRRPVTALFLRDLGARRARAPAASRAAGDGRRGMLVGTAILPGRVPRDAAPGHVDRRWSRSCRSRPVRRTSPVSCSPTRRTPSGRSRWSRRSPRPRARSRPSSRSWPASSSPRARDRSSRSSRSASCWPPRAVGRSSRRECGSGAPARCGPPDSPRSLRRCSARACSSPVGRARRCRSPGSSCPAGSLGLLIVGIPLVLTRRTAIPRSALPLLVT